MNQQEFEAKVAQMRQAQKNYFATKDRAYLTESKALEREIDKELEARKNPDTQKGLFDLDPDTPAYVSLDKNPPDIKNGRFVSFRSKVGATHVQVLNSRDVYFKTVMDDGRVSTMTFDQDSARELLQYIVERDSETKGGEQ